jgi:hypothetical protein
LTWIDSFDAENTGIVAAACGAPVNLIYPSIQAIVTNPENRRTVLLTARIICHDQ